MRAAYISLLMLLPSLAMAEGWGGMAGAVSNYVSRGLTLSDNDPSLQVDLHYHGSGAWFAGAGTATVKRGYDGDVAAEINAYLGRDWALTPEWSARLVASHYAYAGSSDLYDYDEVEASLGFRRRVTLTLAASPDTYQTLYADSSSYPGDRRGPAYAAEVAVSQPMAEGLAASAGLGYRDLRELADVGYVYGSIGLDYARGPLTLGASRIGTSHAALRICCGERPVNRWVANVFWHF